MQKIDASTKMYLLTINGVCGWEHYNDAINLYASTNDINPKSFSDLDLLHALEEYGVKDWEHYDSVLSEYTFVNKLGITISHGIPDNNSNYF